MAQIVIKAFYKLEDITAAKGALTAYCEHADGAWELVEGHVKRAEHAWLVDGFSCDYDARLHVINCPVCKAKLARELLQNALETILADIEG